MKISYRKTFQGAYELSTIFKGEYIHFMYFNYTKDEATIAFKKYVKEYLKQIITEQK